MPKAEQNQCPCAFCGNDQVLTDEHHLLPKSKGGKESEKVWTCPSCHLFIHKTWTHNELRDYYHTVERILSDERMQRFVKWLKKQAPTSTFKTKRYNGRENKKYG